MKESEKSRKKILAFIRTNGDKHPNNELIKLKMSKLTKWKMNKVKVKNLKT